MKQIFLHIAAWFLLACVMVNLASDVLFPVEQHGPVVVAIDAHNDSLPADGKEERAEWLKFARQQAPSNPCFRLVELLQPYLIDPLQLKRQFYPPVISPPPKKSVA